MPQGGRMRFKHFKMLMALAVLAFLSNSFPVTAGEVTDRLRLSTDKLIEIVANSELNTPERQEERNKAIRESVDEVFDWEAFSKRALGRHWNKLEADDKDEFIHLFARLLEHTYLDKTSQYSGAKIEYLEEALEKEYGVVKAKVITTDNKEVAVEYRLENKEGEWLVYDLYVEGVSLVNNYRVQFNDIITKSSYDELIKRLYAKVEKNQEE
jgi:phospholipid transport system substrate-binding protein